MSIRVARLGAVLSACIASGASADTLDFTGLPEITLITSATLNLTNATLTSEFDAFQIIDGGTSNGLGRVAAVDPVLYSAAADLEISFAYDVADLSFFSFGWGSGDTAEITAFLDGSSLGSLTVASNGLIDFSSFGAIDALFIDDSSTANGMGYGDFSFSAAEAAVPLPAALPMLLAGVAALGAMGFRARA